MRTPIPHRRTAVGINLTPMIDVTFLLIIFFLLSSHLAHQETQIELELPEAASGQQLDDDNSPRLSVNVANDGSVMLGSTAATTAEMPRRLQIERARLGDDLEIRIRAARSVPYSAVEPILIACADAGIWNVTFAVHRKGEGGARRSNN